MKISSNTLSMVASMVRTGAAGSAEAKVTFILGCSKTESKCYSSIRVTTATDQTVYQFETVGEEEGLQFTVNCKKFAEVADSLASFGKDVDLIAEDSNAVLSIEGMATLRLPVMEADEQASFDVSSAVGIMVTAKAMLSLLRRGGMMADKNNSIESTKAAALRATIGTGELNCWSTNGNVVALSSTKADKTNKNGLEKESLTIGIPADAFNKVIKYLSDGTQARLMLNETACAMSTGKCQYIFTLAASVFDASGIVAKFEEAGYKQAVSVDADTVINAVKLLKVADAESKVYSLATDGEKLEILSSVEKTNKVSLSTVEMDGSLSLEGKLGISAQYLEKIVKALDKGNVTIRTNDGSTHSPFVFTNGTATGLDTTCIVYCLKAKQ